MKYLPIAFFILFPLLSHSQQYSVVKIEAVSAAKGRLEVAYEHSFSKHMSAQLKFESGIYDKQNYTSWDGGYKARGYGVTPEIRLYPFRGEQKSPDGLFLGVSYRYAKIIEEYLQPYSSFVQYSAGDLSNIGLSCGYKHSVKRFWMEIQVKYGAGRVQYDHPGNAALIPQFYSNEFIKNETDFFKVEFSFGYLFISPKVL